MPGLQKRQLWPRLGKRIECAINKCFLRRLSWRTFLRTLGIQFNVMQPRRRHIVLVENGFDRALRNTGFTVDAFIWVDVDHVRVFVKAIAWANLQASLIFAAFARFSHDHRHNRVPPVRIVGNKAGTGGGENLDNKADSEFKKFSDSSLTNRASHELVSLWHSGSQDAASVLLARYPGVAGNCVVHLPVRCQAK